VGYPLFLLDLLTNSLINVHCENLVSIYEAAGGNDRVVVKTIRFLLNESLHQESINSQLFIQFAMTHSKTQ
jgi:hypothetical protein